MFKDAHKYYFIAMTNDNKDFAFASDITYPYWDKAWDMIKTIWLAFIVLLTTRGVIDRNNGYLICRRVDAGCPLIIAC